jgi:hypothetical protein
VTSMGNFEPCIIACVPWLSEVISRLGLRESAVPGFTATGGTREGLIPNMRHARIYS